MDIRARTGTLCTGIFLINVFEIISSDDDDDRDSLEIGMKPKLSELSL